MYENDIIHFILEIKLQLFQKNELGLGAGVKLRLGSREANLKFTAVIQVMNDEAAVVNSRINYRFAIYPGGRINRS